MRLKSIRCGHTIHAMPPSPLLTPLAAAVLHVGDPERILEVECGEGDGTLFLAREFPGARVRGVDRSAEAVRHAAGRTGLDPEGRIAFKQGSPHSLPFPDDHFDLLAAVDAKPKLSEAARVLHPGGFLILAATASHRFHTSPRNSKEKAGNDVIAGWLLRRRLSRAGFEPIWAEPAGDGSFFIARLRGGGAGMRSL
jgi:ubiquinone/menaquinone biosynthesis C-methylase UbiE